MSKHVMGLLSGLLGLALLAALGVFSAGCSRIIAGLGGYDCMDRSGPISLVADENPPVSQLTGLTSEEQQHVLSSIHPSLLGGLITVGYVDWPSAPNSPEYFADCRAYWAATDDYEVYQRRGTYTLAGDQAVYEYATSSEYDGISEITMRAEFSATAVQDALDQQFTPSDRGFRAKIAPANRLRVPLAWTVSGVINGKAFDLVYTEQAYVKCNYWIEGA